MNTKKNQKFLSLLLVLVMVFVGVPSIAQAETKDQTITILHINDMHGNAVGNDDKIIGLAKLKTIADEIETPKLILDAGDTIHGTPFATISRGSSIVELSNLVGIDAFVPGNHDFNYGSERLLELIDKMEYAALANNIVDKEEKLILDDTELFDLEGIKVGVFGLATDETKTKSSPVNTEGLEFLNPIDTAKESVKALKKEGANYIIALSHLGLDEESKYKSSDVADKVEGIDLIVDGHSHTLLENGKKVKNTLIVQTGGIMSGIGKVTVEFKDGKATDAKAEVLDFEAMKDVVPDDEVLKAIAEIEAEQKPYLDEVIGKLTKELVGTREVVRAGESNLGQLLTDAMLEVGNADVAITNGGGIRASIEPGEITRGDVLTSFPFTNYPVVVKATGAVIEEALNYGITEYPKVAGKFPHIAGMEFVLDLTDDVKVAKNIIIGGEPIDLKKEYKLVTNDFMFGGGDGYAMLKGLTKVSEHGLLSEVLEKKISALTEANGNADVELEERIHIQAYDRIFGLDRYETAEAISKKYFESAKTAIIARGDIFPDALSGGNYASLLEAPILLSSATGLSSQTNQELVRLGVEKVIILGGVNAVPESVVAALKTLNIKSERIAGANRFETAALIVKAAADIEGVEMEVTLARGDDFPDALTASAYSAKNKQIGVLLTDTKELSAETLQMLEDLKIKKVTIIGGTAAVNEKVETQLDDKRFEVVRIAGKDRFETAENVAKEAFKDATTAYVVDGYNFPDALAIAPQTKNQDAPLILVKTASVEASTKTYLSESAIEDVTIIGGVNAVSYAVDLEILNLLK